MSWARAALLGLLLAAALPAASGADAPPTCLGETATVVGTPGPDVLQATGYDVVAGLGGDDTITATGGGQPLVCAGDGNDTVVISSAGAVVSGDAGDDRIDASGSTQVVLDYEDAPEPRHRRPGRGHRDRLGHRHDRARESAAGLVLRRHPYRHRRRRRPGRRPRQRSAHGRAGDDVLLGARRRRHARRAARDGTPIAFAGVGIRVDLAAGTCARRRHRLGARSGGRVGTTGRDVILGNASANRLTGDSGNDVLAGRGGDDRIDAGDGDDRVSDGPGNDGVDAGPGDDVLDESAAATECGSTS